MSSNQCAYVQQMRFALPRAAQRLDRLGLASGGILRMLLAQPLVRIAALRTDDLILAWANAPCQECLHYAPLSSWIGRACSSASGTPKERSAVACASRRGEASNCRLSVSNSHTRYSVDDQPASTTRPL
jgi:hypothetical protein